MTSFSAKPNGEALAPAAAEALTLRTPPRAGPSCRWKKAKKKAAAAKRAAAKAAASSRQKLAERQAKAMISALGCHDIPPSFMYTVSGGHVNNCAVARAWSRMAV